MSKNEEVRAIDANHALRLLTDLLDKETGAYSKGRNYGLNVARGILRNPDASSTLTLNTMRDEVYQDAVAHGLWESTDYTVQNILDEQESNGTPFENTDEVLRSWAMEPIRKEVNELEMASETEEEYAEELADVIIMSLSVAGKLGIDIDAAVRRKMEINRQRPWKHGKEAEHEIRKPL